MRRFVNGATPDAASTVVVPVSVVPAPEAAIVTLLLKPVATLPTESRAVTTTPPEPELMTTPAVVGVPGWLVNTRLAGGAGVIVNVLLASEAGIPGVVAWREYPGPAVRMCRFENCATPETAATVVWLVGVNEPPDGLVANPIVTLPVKEVTTLPN